MKRGALRMAPQALRSPVSSTGHWSAEHRFGHRHWPGGRVITSADLRGDKQMRLPSERLGLSFDRSIQPRTGQTKGHGTGDGLTEGATAVCWGVGTGVCEASTVGFAVGWGSGLDSGFRLQKNTAIRRLTKRRKRSHFLDRFGGKARSVRSSIMENPVYRIQR